MTGRAARPAAVAAAAARTSPSAVSAWAPLGRTVFRVLWSAQLGSNIGSWMQTVGAQWFLVEHAASPTTIALVQTASLAPAVLLSIPAGALADSSNRRTLLIWGTAASAVLATGLTAITGAGLLDPANLLVFTFLLGVCATLTSPAWQAIQPELVPREEVVAAAALGGVTVNGARAIGPALAGLLLAGLGTPAVFAINAASFVGAVVALIWWKRPPQSGLDDRERFWPALRAGIRYTASAHLIRRILLRSALFAFPASALWALLPITATRMGLDSGGYGILLGALGVGAVIGVVALPPLRRRLSDTLIVALSAAVFAVGTFAAAFLPFLAALVLLIPSGVAWIGTLTVLNAALQLTLPQWVRSRALGVYILVFMGSMALGSVAFGAAAQAWGTSTALVGAAVLLGAVAASTAVLPLLPGTSTIDRTVAHAWASPALVFDPEPAGGPVLVLITYPVKASAAAEFEQVMRQVERSRRRTGAYRWRLYRSGDAERVMLESFLVASWDEFRRQRTERRTGRDREIEKAATRLCDGTPVEQYFFSPNAARTPNRKDL